MSQIERTEHDVYPYISPSNHLKDAAKGKTIIITGGGRGCGKAMTEYFGLAGASRVYIAGRSKSTLDAAKAELEPKVGGGFQIEAVETDVTSVESVQALFDRVKADGLVPDVLINNSGTNENDASIADSDPIKWWGDVEVSVKGMYLCTRAYLQLLNGRPGVILNVTSGVCDVVSPLMSAYGMAKLAVNRFTESVHFENGHHVRCIAFTPGGIPGTGLSARMAKLGADHPFNNRLLDKVDLAGAFAVYLTTPAAEFFAGRYTMSNWDMEKVEAIKDEIVEQDLLKSRLNYGDKLSPMLIGRDGKPVVLQKS